MNALQTYIKAERGRLSKLAEAIHVTPGAIAQWKKVPAERVPQVSEATGIPRAALRPDLYEAIDTTPEAAE